MTIRICARQNEFFCVYLFFKNKYTQKMSYTTRIIEKSLSNYLTAFPVVGLTGPRQSGKSTVLQHCLSANYRYVSFDDRETINLFYDDPKRFMKQFNNHIIFDEAQKVPEIFDAVKLLVDTRRQEYGQFILTGSSQFNMMQSITESLAGRIGLLTLLPFQASEIPEALREESIYTSSYPELVTRKFYLSDDWYRSYLTTYLEKDVRQISQVGNIRDLNVLIRLLAINVGQQLHLSDLSKEIGVSVSTVKRWISILEASYIIFLLPPFYKNYGKRICKTPKVYFYDTGLVSHLTRTTTQDLFENGPMLGKIFENYIVSEMKKRLSHENISADLYYYRTQHGVEVDLIIDYVTHKKWIEIKASHTLKSSMFSAMQGLMEPQDSGVLVYRGQSKLYDDSLVAENYKEFLDTVL